MLEAVLTLNPRGGGPRVAVVQITNDTTGSEDVGHYDVMLDALGIETRVRLEGFARKRGHVELLIAALDVLTGGRLRRYEQALEKIARHQVSKEWSQEQRCSVDQDGERCVHWAELAQRALQTKP